MDNENLIKKPFESKRLQEEMDKDKYEILNIRINKEEREMLNNAKIILQQEKDGTALKQLAYIGFHFVLQDQKMIKILDYIINNKRRNQRQGIIETEINFDKYLANVIQKKEGVVTQTE